MSSESSLLQDPRSFWDSRHRDLDAWRSGGDRGISEAENYEFYIYRLGKLIELVRRFRLPTRGLRILDAGCGKGFVSDQLSRCGYWVTGIDGSPSAIEFARANYRGEFILTSLEEYRAQRLYDVVIVLDVLFHVLDDVAFENSMVRVTRALRAGGLLILSDAMPDRRQTLGNYIVHRSRSEYEEVARRLGLRLMTIEPYAFGSNPNSLAAFTKEGP